MFRTLSRMLLWALGALVAAAAGFLAWALWASRASESAPALPAGRPPDPARDTVGMLDRLKRLNGYDETVFGMGADRFNAACASVLVEPEAGRDPEPRGTIVYFHGYTNCPAQFAEAAHVLASKGWRVLGARAPLHGEKDVLNRDLDRVTAKDLIEHVNLTIDVAAGLSGPIHVIGLSGGGILSAYAAATRTEVDGLLCMAPTTVPMGMPLFVARLFVDQPWTMPDPYFWWDPRKKAALGESPYVYPGFPFKGLQPYLHLGQALWSGQVVPNHTLEFANLQLNPGDFAVRKDAARGMMAGFAGHAKVADEIVLTKQFGWWHDFIDQHGTHSATPEQVAAIVLYGLNIDDEALDRHWVAYREPAAAGLARGSDLDAMRLDEAVAEAAVRQAALEDRDEGDR